ncbi:XrtA system polysaccharide chain length determinant [Marinobacter sp. CA1]|uniref:XrtA system polysaccharide chain length determinant n=1 Tax=Marinobacter sp. CA1 TaxID=2817656 RepID=UPI001D08CA06|nr:XrtA system polysaccharide chain length determinant [Marinobacter sp. CA1]UDL03340.1 chain length-determining protein [Marinobacter sp. CA1]
MDVQFILDLIKSLRRELYEHRVAAAVIFMAVTSGVLAFGYLTPKTYTSEALLYADQSTILEPLLRGQAEVTDLDRISEARELIQSRSFLEQVGSDTGLIRATMDDGSRNGAIQSLRNRLNLRVSNRNFLELTYRSGDPDQSFRVLSTALNRFIERTVRKKRSESQGAFEFIDSQVKLYQRQLEDAERRLKDFKSNNQDGTEGSVQSRIEGLRASIENLKLEIQQTEAEIRLTTSQLETEQPVRRVTVDPGQSSLERRLAALHQELDSLRLRYHDSHPDVVSVLGQIEDLEQQVAASDGSDRRGAVTEVMENPVYESLKLQLAESQTQLEVKRNRLASLQTLLDEAFARAERVAVNQAELSELTRDYDVTRNVYEDMLQRREKARLSMTLDVQGEGVSYQIQEPATYPTQWDGLQLYQVGIAGPFLGSAVVLGVLTMLVMFDQRLRSVRALHMALPESIPVLGSIPHYSSTWKERLLRKDVLVLLAILGLFLFVYLNILVFSVMGIQVEQIIAKLTGLVGE